MLKICILLTATIDPMGITFLNRDDPAVREKDYIISMKKWIKNTDYPLVFCENSGVSIDKIKETARGVKNRDIEFLQFYGNDFPRRLGKGYGDLGIIKYALSHSRFLNSCDYIIKVTGRIFVKNIDKIVAGLQSDKDIYVMTDGIIFAFKRSFAYDFLFPLHDSIDDSKGYIFEHAFKDAVSLAMHRGFRCVDLPCTAKYVGVKGGTNVRYDVPLISRVFNRLRRVGRKSTEFLWDTTTRLLWYIAVLLTKIILSLRPQRPRELKSTVATTVFAFNEFEKNHSKIPKIIHQIWVEGEVPYKLRRFADSVKTLNPDWQYKLWTGGEMEDWVKVHYPDLIDVYQNHANSAIHKANMFRYLVLSKMGGVYMDMDFECIKPLNFLFHKFVKYHELVVSLVCFYPDERKDKYLNAFIGCIPGHPFWDELIKELCKRVRDNKYVQLRSTGTLLFGEFVDKYPGKIDFIYRKVAYPFFDFYNIRAPASEKLQVLMMLVTRKYYPETCMVHYWHHSYYTQTKNIVDAILP